MHLFRQTAWQKRLLKSGYHDENLNRNLWPAISAGMVWTGRFTNKKKDGTLYQEEATITTGMAGDQAELRLADTGSGIPPAIIDKIFAPFFTTKPVGKGSGQGLSAAHGIIVDKHGGTMVVSSTEGEGAEFIITLPLS